MEKLHSKTRVKGDLCSLEVRAPATAKMANKSMKCVAIDVCQNATSPLNEAAEVGSGSNVSNYRTALAQAYPSRSRSSANASMCGPLIPLRKRRSVLGAEKNFSSMGSPC